MIKVSPQSPEEVNPAAGHQNRMKGSLFLLILIGHCYFFRCQLYKYHFIDQGKNWTEAQTYCREKYTDLATVFKKADVERLCKAADDSEKAWIGLYNTGSDNRTWHWSLPGVEFNDSNTNWAGGEPNDKVGQENCARMDNGNKWRDDNCKSQYQFVCYNEKKPHSEKFHLIETKEMWREAQNYCRENFTDLVSGVTQLEDRWFQNKTKLKNITWIGLFRDTWKWSDGNNSSFRFWQSFQEFNNEDKTKKCAMMVNHFGKWSSGDCSENKTFFCYDDNVVLIHENKTWEEALYYCRENFHDLVSITNLEEQKWVEERAKNASTPFVWLGLRYTCTLGFWFWVTDEVVTYENWASEGQMDECDMSGVMKTHGQHEWFKKNDTEKFNFMCFKF